ncbi:hypothetical protein Q4508_19650 [Amphritea sp. 2_MG-2023]|uniref:hypothetical protein n=1 Tax=Amphritea TaxID=515417 RepID=UPI001C066C97|nr:MULTISPECIES: hypothetical protein [Amphritea]MBU2965864.1 hypothetical protein [Amphritea atlantica]MDO6420775.1 hypothetical protein [Amphritea sp. 2_MG-2023]MDX2423216.1 hypothetical protein [Amphritea sp.]
MRLIVLMVVVLIIGLLTVQQMAPNTESSSTSVEPNATNGNSEIPAVPTRPSEVKQFGKDMDQYIQDEMAKRVEAMEAATKQ